MKSVYFGTDGFAAAVLTGLVEAGKAPDLVVSRPDSRQGRGRKLAPPPVANTALGLGIELIQPETADSADLVDAIESIAPDVVSLCAFGALIREPLLSDYEILNVHPSLLPRWRGAAPIERSLMAGDEVTGVSIIRLVEALDAGPVALAREVPIDPSDDFGSLSARLQEVGTRLLVEAIDLLASGEIHFTDQPSEGAIYAERIEAGDRVLDPTVSAAELERTVRALRPHIGARLELPSGEFLGVREAFVDAPGPPEGGLAEAEGALLLGCAENSLRITRVIPPGGKELDAADWLRGRPDLG